MTCQPAQPAQPVARPYMGKYIDRRHYRLSEHVRAATRQCGEIVRKLGAQYRERQFGPNLWLRILELQSEVCTARDRVVNGGTNEQMEKWNDELWDAYEAIEAILGGEQ